MSLKQFIVFACCLHTASVAADTIVLTPDRHHLRTAGEPEWARFAETSEGNRLSGTWTIDGEPSDGTLLIRQTDVRLTWKVIVNGKEVGRLQRDENDLVQAISVPAETLRAGANQWVIEGTGDVADDVEVGPVRWSSRPMSQWLEDARVEVQVTDSQTGAEIPCRLTIVDENGSLFPVSAESNDTLAVRTGVVYTSTGRASFGLAAGNYHIFAGRGFEYGRAVVNVSAKPSETLRPQLSIRRQVDTSGWVACDTHVHTVTHSGHGDATIAERMVTLAGEGVELPIATDHNKQINYRPEAVRQNVEQFFTPVIGNEVTTDFGHFNAFPFRPETPVPDHTETDWQTLLPAIYSAADVEVVILNHGRDVHRGYRPLGPENLNAASGDSLDGRPFLFNAMETVNSGAQQTDPLELFRDWMTLTNRGLKITPIGSSDSHDVNRYIVGQGRTYVRVNDDDPGNIDVDAACESIRQGRVVVSAGLFVDANALLPGDLDKSNATEMSVIYSVRCPDWITPSSVALYQNGERVQATELRSREDREGVWTIPWPKHDVFLTVLAVGPGVRHPSWPIAQPYQPDHPQWAPTVLSFTGAIWIDADGDGKFASARELAERLMRESGGDFQRLVDSLADYDQAVAIQAAALWQAEHGTLLQEPVRSQWTEAAPACRRGFQRYLQAWRESELARVENP